ncbi:hypothetical protein BDQ17DRAFT_1236762 [Cyathus striatus]|nr:hypothetical protein BDQ17DRAFT_1236762 [Cyathus striatus]
MSEPEPIERFVDGPKQLAQRALDANRTLQDLLTRHAERLGAELIEVDRLLANDDAADESEPDVQIPGAKKANTLFPSYEFLKPESPFFEDATRRAHYINNTTLHPMKGKELEVLLDAIYNENTRLQVLQDRERSQGLNTNVILNIRNTLDWNVISEKVQLQYNDQNMYEIRQVTDISTYTRSAEECRIKWLGELRPEINRDDWTIEEVQKLKNIISETQEHGEGKLDWNEIARKLGTNRTPIECMKQGIPRPRHTWSSEGDQKLLAAVEKYGVDNWAVVARNVSEHVTAAQCQSRYAKTLDPSIKRGTWSVDEDNRLRKAVAVHGNAWTEVARCITGRTNDQCRERWSEQLNVSAKGEWRKEDDDALREAHKTMGNQWKAISQKLGIGKTDSQVIQTLKLL